MIKFLVFVLLLYNNIQSGFGQCATDQSFAENSPNSKSGENDGFTNAGYIMLGGTTGYTIDCCGVAKAWEADVDGAGTVYFQIWRPSGSSYELVGENEITFPNGGEQMFTIATGSRISIRSGDRMGWYSPGTNIVEHKTVGAAPDNTVITSMTKPTVGSFETWGAGVSYSNRIYAVRLIADGGTSPNFGVPALGTTHTIKNDAPIGQLIDTLTWSDSDFGDTLTATMATSARFAFDATSGQVTIATSLSGPTVTETLTFTVTDFCSNTDTLVLTINIVNDPPVIQNLPASGTLIEDSTLQTLLYTINATDTVDDVTCQFDPSVPGTYPFSVLLIPGTSTYGIYVNANPGLDYDTLNQYSLTVVCNDGSQDSNVETYYVYLVENQPPVIHNLQGATTLSTASPISTTVFTVDATDQEGDTLTFTMTCVPTPCPFDIFASGQIQLKESIATSTTTGYDLYITVADGRTTVGPKILTVIIQDINDPVLISNLPLASSIAVPENTALGTSVFTVSYSDQDTQTWTFTTSSTPGTGLSYFTLDSTGLISTSGGVLDYETLAAAGTTSFTFTISVNDGTASDTDPLVIDVINVNEAPSFAQNSYSLSTPEASAGTVIGTPTFGVSDPDAGDSFTYAMDCGADTRYFLMNTATGQVSFQSDYDIDAGLASAVTCTVTVTDSGSLTDTATLLIYISDINDQAPVFSPVSYSFFMSYYASVGTNVGTVTATDSDTGSFGTLTYTIDQTSLLDEYFAIDNNGLITLKKAAQGNPIGYATAVTLNATASDGGGLSDSAVVTIVISDTTTTVTTTTTDRYKTFFDDTRNIAWFVACLVLVAISAVYLSWLLCTCSGDKSCRAFRSKFCPRKRGWRPRPQRVYSPPRSLPRVHRPTELLTVRKPPPPISEQAWRTGV